MSIFSVDSKLYRGLSLVADLVLVNLVTVLACLPVVSIGAAVTANYACCQAIIEGRMAGVVSTWWRSFRSAFPRAILPWLLTLALTGLLSWEWYIATQLANPTIMLMSQAVLAAALLIVGLTQLWLWPLIAREITDVEVNAGSNQPHLNLVKRLQAALLAAFGWLPRSVVGLVIWAVPAAIVMINPQIGIRLLFGYLVIGVSLGCYLVSLLCARPLGLHPEDELEDPDASHNTFLDATPTQGKMSS